MGITKTAVDAADISAYDADKPCFIVNNVLSGAGYTAYLAAALWRRDETAVPTKPTFAASGTSISASLTAQPLSRVYDKRASLYTSPDNTGSNYWFFGLFETTWNTVSGYAHAEYSQSFYADSVVIKAHEWGQAGAYKVDAELIDMYIGSQHDFTTPTGSDVFDQILNQEVYFDDPDTATKNPRRSGQSHTITSVNSGLSNYRYKIDGNAYFRIEFTVKSQTNTYDSSPKIGEIFVGERIQLSRNPNQPYQTELAYEQDTTDFLSNSGDRMRYVRSKGRRVFELTFTPSGDDSYGIDDIARLKLLAKKTKQFTEPFIYIPKPKTEPSNAFFVYAEDANFQMSMPGPIERMVTLRLVEIPPYVDYEIGL